MLVVAASMVAKIRKALDDEQSLPGSTSGKTVNIFDQTKVYSPMFLLTRTGAELLTNETGSEYFSV
ncbi:hypothetical protein CHS0354_039048, partial [Potamilus streckersoni]